MFNIVFESERLVYRTTDYNSFNYLNKVCNGVFYRYVKSTDEYTEASNENSVYSFMAYNKETHEFIGHIKCFYPLLDNLWIQMMLVRAEQSRKGYGTEIVTTIIEKFSISGSAPLRSVYLTCNSKNQIGIAFWKALGFQKIKDNVKYTSDLYKVTLQEYALHEKEIEIDTLSAKAIAENF